MIFTLRGTLPLSTPFLVVFLYLYSFIYSEFPGSIKSSNGQIDFTSFGTLFLYMPRCMNGPRDCHPSSNWSISHNTVRQQTPIQDCRLTLFVHQAPIFFEPLRQALFRHWKYPANDPKFENRQPLRSKVTESFQQQVQPRKISDPS